MKYVDEFRDQYRGEALLLEIEKISHILGRRIKIMEVCGGHTHSIFKYGLEGNLT